MENKGAGIRPATLYAFFQLLYKAAWLYELELILQSYWIAFYPQVKRYIIINKAILLIIISIINLL